MVAVFNKELLSWYLITLKLKETVEAGIQNLQSPTAAARSIEYPSEQEQYHLVKQQQQQRSDLLQIVISEDRNVDSVEEAEAKSPEPDWVINIRERLEQARQEDVAGAWGKLSIYRVPQCLREGDEKAYIPQTVSLGPYHRGKKRLRNMERHKWRALYHVLKRTRQDVKLYLDSVKELEEKAAACYEGQIGLGSNEFVEMMVLDGCFVLELFRASLKDSSNLAIRETIPFSQCVDRCTRFNVT
ncbi:hypothetical protein C3L33_01263, partial [Rhododendron williamsianum]